MDTVFELATNFQNQKNSFNKPLDVELKNYSQMPHLLDPFLEKLVRKLTAIYLNDRSLVWPLNSLYILCNVRGYKQVSKFLDTEPELLGETVRCIREEPTLEWQSRYILLLWLGTLLLLPFDLKILGDNLYETIFTLCVNDLVRSSKERDAAAIVMARLVSRENPEENTRRFLDWQNGGTGTLQVLAELCRSKVWYPNEFTAISSRAESETDLKLAIKIKSRIAIQYPYLESAEDTINFLFETLSSKSTSLRYSSAKALARICKKLRAIGQEQVAQDIVREIFTGFKADQIEGPDRLSLVSDDLWHGSLLFIAELLRQKEALDYHLLEDVLDDALHFEQKRISVSVGANVRDAGCYVCWAVFKSYTVLDECFLRYCYESLVGLACFDREVNIRRAAAAALQEGLGRHHGFETSKVLQMIESVNFQSVGQVSRCYLEIAPHIVPQPHLRYLVQHGVCSWDLKMRRLSAKSLELFSDPPIDEIIELFKVPDHDVKHGVLCAWGAVYRGPLDPLSHVLNYDFDYTSELVCEGLLAFLKCAPSMARRYMPKCMWASTEPVLENLRSLVPLLEEDMSMSWIECVEESPSYVVALAAQNPKLLLQVASVQDPQSRKIVIENLERCKEAEKLVTNALCDYQKDARGDVGSWVRIAAIDKVKEWRLFTARTLASLWRMTCESLERVRVLSSECLALSGVQLSLNSSPAKYFNSVLSQAEPSLVAAGIATCIGGRSGSIETADGALYALINNLMRLAPDILELGWQGEIGLNALRTVARTLELGYSDVYDSRKLLRVGYNATVNTREIPRILCGLEILKFSDDKRATERLAKLIASPFSSVRVRAAEILFELGFRSGVLVETDWTIDGYTAKARQVLEAVQSGD